MQNRLGQEFVQSQDISLLLKVVDDWAVQVILKDFTFGNKRVNLLLLDLPANLVNKERNL